MTTKDKVKIRRFIVALCVVVVMMLLSMYLPCMQTATCVVHNGELLVERTNKYNTNVLVDLIIVEENGNVSEQEVRVPFEGSEVHYRFNTEYFKEMLDTDQTVYIKGVAEELMKVFTYVTIPVTFLMASVMIFMFVSLWYMLTTAFKS